MGCLVDLSLWLRGRMAAKGVAGGLDNLDNPPTEGTESPTAIRQRGFTFAGNLTMSATLRSGNGPRHLFQSDLCIKANSTVLRKR
jgi:hypothetical protein